MENVANKEFKAATLQDVAIAVGVAVVTLYIIVYLISEIDGLIELGTDSPYSSLLTSLVSNTTSAFGMIGIALFVVPCTYVLQLLNFL